MIEPTENDEDIYIGQDNYQAKLAYRWSLRGQLQRKYIALMSRKFKWWITMGILIGFLLGLFGGVILLTIWGW